MGKFRLNQSLFYNDLTQHNLQQQLLLTYDSGAIILHLIKYRVSLFSVFTPPKQSFRKRFYFFISPTATQ
jgi:hypothetical protein